MRLPRIRHLRRYLNNLTGTRRKRLQAWADYIASNLSGTGTGQTFTCAAVLGTNTLTFGANASNNETVTIDGKVYTFKSTLDNVDGHVQIGVDASTSLDNLIAAINLADRQSRATGTLTLGTNPSDSDVAAEGTLTLTGNAVDAVKASGVLTLTGNFAGAVAVGTLTLTGNALDIQTATGVLTLTGNAQENEQVVIGTTTYEFTTAVNSPYDVLIGASASDSIDNLIAAITYDGGAGTNEGVKYGTGTVANTAATAAAGAGDTMDVTALTAGTAGNSVATTTDMANASWAQATLTGGAAAETVTIGSTVYTFKDTLGAAYDVKIGASASDTIDNLIAAINYDAGEGSLYGTGTEIHPDVSAAAGAGDTMDLSAKVGGTAGNSIATTETMSAGSFGGGTLSGGAALETVTLGATTYTFQTTLVDSPNYVKIGATASDTIDNLIAAITAGAGEGTVYGTGTTANASATAAAGAGDTMDATALTAGTAGNSIASAGSSANHSWGTATLTGGLEAETVTIGSTVYTFKDTLGAAYDVKIGAAATNTIDNLIAAINGDAGEGTLYGTDTVAHLDVTATAGDGDTMDIDAAEAGIAGNSIATTDTMSAGSWGATTLAGGTGDETVTIGAKTYTFQGTPSTANDVKIGDTASDTLDNLVAAINGAAGAGTLYGTGTTANADATAAAGEGDTVTLTAVADGAAGSLVATTETLADGSFGATTLAGGVDLYAAATTIHSTVSAAAGAGDTMVVTSKVVHDFGVDIDVATTVTSASWANAAFDDNRINIVGHGYASGDGPFVVSTTGALPTPLATTSLYWVEKSGDNYLYLHTSKKSALDGVAPINLTTAGSGTLTLTPATSAQAVIEHLRQGVSVARLQAETDVDNLI